uniref:Uncharacterized protein n=1 Tax=Acrobeloides nanus TaxID=290746 RepID=A0A914CN03_9BILA
MVNRWENARLMNDDYQICNQCENRTPLVGGWRSGPLSTRRPPYLAICAFLSLPRGYTTTTCYLDCIPSVVSYKNGQSCVGVDAMKNIESDIVFAKRAGFEQSVEFIDEIEAATVCYAKMVDLNQAPHLLLVFKFSAGSFKVAVVEENNGMVDVKARSGNPNLGGVDITIY